MDRTKYLGGSDIAAAMGLSRWTTPLQLWAEKTGEVEPADLSGVEAVQLGSELEDFVAKKFQKETGMKVRRAPKRYIHDKYPHFACQVDRLIEGTDELLECKTCSAWKAKEWEGEDIPIEYILQVMWQLIITGRKVGWIAVLIGGQSFKYKKIGFDSALADDMIKKAVAFWKMVEEHVHPMAVGADNETIFKIYPENDDQIQQVQEFEHQIALFQETKMHISEMEKEKDKLSAEIKQRIGDNLGLQTAKYVVKWSPQSRSLIDFDRLKADGLYDKYKKESKSRVLRVSKTKE